MVSQVNCSGWNNRFTTDAQIFVIFIFFENMMKYKIYVGLLTLFSFISHTEWWFENDFSGFNGKISLYFILIYSTIIVGILLYKSIDKFRFLYILILLMNTIIFISRLMFYIGSLHMLD